MKDYERKILNDFPIDFEKLPDEWFLRLKRLYERSRDPEKRQLRIHNIRLILVEHGAVEEVLDDNRLMSFLKIAESNGIFQLSRSTE